MIPANSARKYQNASTDPAFLHNLLAKISSDDVTERVVSFGSLVATFGSTDKALEYLGATKQMSGVIGNLGKVSGSIGFAGGVLDELGGWNNLVQSYQNAGSNISWLFQGATYDDWLNFGTLTSTKTTSLALNAILTYSKLDKLNTAYGVASDSYKVGTGGDIITGDHVQSVIQGLVDGVSGWFQ